MPESTEPVKVVVCVDEQRAQEKCVLEKGEQECKDVVASLKACLESNEKS